MRNLKVIVDARMVSSPGHGIGNYVAQLAKGLAEKELPYQISFLINEKTPVNLLHGFPTLKLQSPFLAPFETFEIQKALKNESADLYHSPSFSSLLDSPCPWVVTVHDLNHLHYGSAAKKFYYRFLLKPFIRKAEKILTVSEFSKREISEWGRISAHQITVTANPLEPIDRNSESQFLGTHNLASRKYFLCLSNSKPHKNLPFLLRVYENYRNEATQPWPLVIATTGLQEKPGLVQIPGINPRDVDTLLRNAGALLSPSLYEGFGRPPLEGLLAGTSVIVSDIPPHRETLSQILAKKGAYRLLSPIDEMAWVEALVQQSREAAPILSDSQEIERQILERFHYSKLANLMDQIYRDVLEI